MKSTVIQINQFAFVAEIFFAFSAGKKIEGLQITPAVSPEELQWLVLRGGVHFYTWAFNRKSKDLKSIDGEIVRDFIVRQWDEMHNDLLVNGHLSNVNSATEKPLDIKVAVFKMNYEGDELVNKYWIEDNGVRLDNEVTAESFGHYIYEECKAGRFVLIPGLKYGELCTKAYATN